MRRVTGFVAAAAVAVGFAGAAAGQDIVIASVGPMTGQYAAFGEQLRRGAEMAVENINAKGGVLGRKLKLEIGDDACDPKQAVAVANQLASKKVALVAGHFCSSSSIPASAVYNENGILQITPASTNPALTEDAAKKGWKNVFRTCGRDDAQGLVAGKFLATKYKGKGVAILHDKSAYGKGLADETKKAMNAAGHKEAMYEAITQGDKDFTALISKMKAAKVEVIYLGGYHTEAGLLVRQAREQGFGAQLISGDALVTDEFWKITGKAGEGTRMTFAPDPRKVPDAKDVVAQFKAKNYDPEGYTLYTYAAIQVWAEAANKAKSIKTADVAKQLRTGKYKTVIGTLEFNSKGDVVNPLYVFYDWKDGKYEAIGSGM
ncbi:branched-chain amino acid ABC transporter substrate-binding protein [Stella sp.]|uniref:branched-chain amino acid ABC transporter substrate-binding protein n=1 Tax=Stella sp. TaxID=2912054 RepID=UPI0035AF0941